jgi:hypothetical protein
VVAEELKGNNVEKTLKGIHGLWYADSGSVGGNSIVPFVAKDDRLSLTSSNLSERGLDLGV